MNPEFLFSGVASLPTRIVAGVTIVWLLAGLAALLLGRFSAALRHRLWSLTMLAAVALPAAVLLLPEVRVGWVTQHENVAGNFPKSIPSFAQESPVTHALPVSPPTKTDSLHYANSPTPLAARPTEASPTETIGRVESSPAAGSGNLWLVVLLVPLLWQLIRIVCSLAMTRGLIRRALPVADERATKVLAQWCPRLCWRSEVRLLASAETNIPLSAGLWRPTVILPADWQAWSDEALSAAIGHELAHGTRHDVAWQLVARVACAIYWFHPLAYLAAWRMKVEREAACDDVVLAAGQPPAAYARVLLDLASRLSVQRVPGLALPMAAGAGLEQRVRAILAGSRARSPVKRVAGLLLLAATILVLLSVGSLSPLAPEIATAAIEEQPAKEEKKVAVEVQKDTVEVLGDVVNEAGKPAANIAVTLISDYGSRPTTRTTADGKFSIPVLRANVRHLMLVARSDDGRRQGFVLYLGETKLPPRERIVLGKSREIAVAVVDAEKRPVAEALVAATSWYAKITDVKSDKDGKAVLLVPAEMPLQYVYALKPDVGLDYFMYRRKNESVSDDHRLAPDHDKPLTLTLAGVRVVRARVVDEKKQPLAGARVNPWYIELPNKGGHFNTIWTMEVTDREGLAEFHTIPANNTQPVTFWAHKEKYFAPERTVFDPAGAANEIASQLLPQVRVHGVVKFADGKPAAGAVVSMDGDGYGTNNSFRAEALCNAEGKFEQFVNSDECYLFSAALDRQISKAELQVVLAGKETPRVELTLEPATRVFGTVFSPPDSKPLAGEYLTMYCRDGEDYYKLPPDQLLPNPTGSTQGLSPRVSYNATTDENGRFEFFAGRGNYWVMGRSIQKNALQFELTGQEELQLRLEADLPPDIELSGKVVMASDKTQVVAKADITAVPIINDVRSPESAKGFGVFSDAAGAFKVLRSPAELLVTARTADGQLGALVTLSADAKELEIPLVPTASARGRLVDSDTGKPLAGQRIDYAFKLKYANGQSQFFYGNFTGTTTSDDRGEFTLTGLLIGGDYLLQLVGPADRPEREMVKVGSVKVEGAGVIELGDVKGKATQSK